MNYCAPKQCAKKCYLRKWRHILRPALSGIGKPKPYFKFVCNSNNHQCNVRCCVRNGLHPSLTQPAKPLKDGLQSELLQQLDSLTSGINCA